jgi:hypothetical protein
MSAELAVIDWTEEHDHQLMLVIGGYNSNYEYWNHGEYRQEIEDTILKCYAQCLSWHEQAGGDKKVFLDTDDINEEIIMTSNDAVVSVAMIRFNNDEEYARERLLPEEKKEDIIDEIINNIWELECGAYCPYVRDVVKDVLHNHGLAYVSTDDTEYETGVLGFVNDCQNALFQECIDFDENTNKTYEGHDLLFVRIPQTLKELGGGSQ